MINKIFTYNFTFNNVTIHFPYQPLTVPNNGTKPVTAKPFEMTFGEDIVETIRKTLKTTLNGKPSNYSDIAILCRHNYEIDIIAAKLKASNMPVEVVGGKGFYKSKEIIDLYKLLNAVIYKSDEYITELMFTDYFNAILKCDNGLSMNEFLSQLTIGLRQSTVENALILIY